MRRCKRSTRAYILVKEHIPRKKENICRILSIEGILSGGLNRLILEVYIVKEMVNGFHVRRTWFGIPVFLFVKVVTLNSFLFLNCICIVGILQPPS